MSEFRIIEYIPTPTAKQNGVIYIGVQAAGIGEIMLGFKVVTTKDGNGRFLADPSWKLEENGQEQWKPWIMIDSNIAKERIRTLAMEYISRYEASQQAQPSQPQATSFGAQTAQPNPYAQPSAPMPQEECPF